MWTYVFNLVLFYLVKKLYSPSLQDDYRIVAFEDVPKHLTLCPRLCLQNVGEEDRQIIDKYLRLHFQHSLGMTAIGGDTREDYGDDAMEEFLWDMGIDVEEDGLEDLSGISFDDSRWQSEVGREVFRFIFAR